MTINNKTIADVKELTTSHTTTEQEFQTGLDDVIDQVGQTQVDIGYDSDLGSRTGQQALSLHSRLNTLEGVVPANQALGGDPGVPSDPDTSTGRGGISGTVGDPIINDGAIGQPQLASDSVTDAELSTNAVQTDHITDDNVTNAKLANPTTSLNLGPIGTTDDLVTLTLGATTDALALNASTDRAGFVPRVTAESQRDLNEAKPTANPYILASDNNWYQIQTWALDNTTEIPSSRISTAGTNRSLTIPAGTDTTTYPSTNAGAIAYVAAAANRTFGINPNDTVVVTDARDSTVYSLSYIGAAVDDSTDAATSDFVSLGSVDAYLAGDGINIAADNTISVGATLSGNKTFSNNVTVNGNTQLGDADTDTVNVMADVASNLIPDGNRTRSLGATGARWNGVFGGASFDRNVTFDEDVTIGNTDTDTMTVNAASTFTGDVGVDNFTASASHAATFNGTTSFSATAAPGVVTAARTNSNIDALAGYTGTPMFTDANTTYSISASTATPGRIVLTGANPASTDQVDIVGGTGLGVAVSGDEITINADTYTQSTWETGTVTTPGSISPMDLRTTIANLAGTTGDAIVDKQNTTTTAGTTAYTFTRQPTDNTLVAIDGLLLVEGSGNDYTVSGSTITLSQAVAAGKTLELVSFRNTNMLGTGDVNPSVLSAGALPIDVTVTDDNLTQIALGDWTISTDGSGNLQFSHSGTVRMRMDTDGNLRAADNITAFDSL